ncbi:MAG: DUF1579 domain-containing protein [Alphaproteobacteria bacterium]|nr:DUF1579 domain-containing protein [Alphaproteobacteria bacterium]
MRLPSFPACCAAFILPHAAGAASGAPPAPPPPCADAEHHALDFWLGEWNAYIPAGQKLQNGGTAESDILAAEASVSSILDGCGYLETWDSKPLANGTIYRGKGFHHYDAKSGTWRQFWIANNGKDNLSVGGPTQDGGVQYTSEQVGPNGGRMIVRQTIEPAGDGAVWNRSEMSTDGGKTWTMAYKFLYRRK